MGNIKKTTEKTIKYDYVSRKEGILNAKILSNNYLYEELIEKQKKVY